MSQRRYAAAVLILSLQACTDDDPPGNNRPSAGGENIVQVASKRAELSTLVAAVTKAGLASSLSTGASLTVFAPTNAAFDTLFGSLGVTNGVDGLTAEQLQPILRYHVLQTEVNAASATSAAQAGEKLDSLGGRIQLGMAGSAVQLDGKATVVTADVDASNGVIHLIDQVLLPSLADIATTEPRFTSLAAALAAADTGNPSPNLVSTLDDDASATGFTVFAPTNEAFAGLIATLAGGDQGATTGITALADFRPDQLLPVLSYHVVPEAVRAAALPAPGEVDTLGGKVRLTRSGASVTVDGVNVILVDVLASNGVIHAMEAVLLPSITDVVTTSPLLSGLKNAVLAADGAGTTSPKLATALGGTDKFTVLAPSNAAFAALGAPPSGQPLTNVLLYHALPGDPLYAAAALALTTPLTVSTALAGESVKVSSVGMPKGVTVEDGTAVAAKVTTANLFTSNGVIHIVDKVLSP